MNATALKRDIVLIVDDTPANLSYLSDALHEAGYKVLVAIDGPTALSQLALITPDIILLDAIMPQMDGFETCRAIKELDTGRDIPIVFMTGLIDTPTIVRAFEEGAVDYLSKPVRKEEVLARITTHITRARILLRAQRSIESCGKAGFTIDSQGKITWQTPRAREWLAQYFNRETGPKSWERLRLWLDAMASAGDPGPIDKTPQLSLSGESGRLKLRYAGTMDGERLLLLEEHRNDLYAERLVQRLGLSAREAEVLNWLAAGKTNRDIAQILGISPRTVNKHLERIYVKLGVETRAAATAIAVQTMTTAAVA